MSLTQEIVDVIERDGRATVPGLAAMFPAYTRLQIQQATYNAVFRGSLVQIERGKGLGRGKGSTHAVFGLAEPKENGKSGQPEPRRYSSVWDLAQA